MKANVFVRGSRFGIKRMALHGWLILGVLIPPAAAAARGSAEEFDASQWSLESAEITECGGRKALVGFAYLKDAVFENGTIELDLWMDGSRSYPGVIFRMQSEGEYERIYLRPHRPAIYGDSIQYVPAFNGIDGWQLYNGPGFTAGAAFPANQWVHCKIEVLEKQARIYVGDMERPALAIADLKHGISKGTLGLAGTRNKSACFSNFHYRTEDGLRFDPPPPADIPPGVVAGWRISQPFKAGEIDSERYPTPSVLSKVRWTEAASEPSGLVDVSRLFGRSGREPEVILARTVLHAEKDEVLKLLFGYSDAASLFLNGTLLFAADSSYQGRDPSFLGIVGLNDAVYLPLRKGDNELLLWVQEAMGGWGFIARDGNARFLAPALKDAWETPVSFRIPESAVYDPTRKVLYVSNYDGYNPSGPEGKQSVSKVFPDGRIERLDWIAGLRNPTGMAVRGDRLFIVERGGLVEADTGTGNILKRTPIPGSQFLNDVAVDALGRIYLSDSTRHVIYRVAGDTVEEWLASPDLKSPNGLFVDGDRLLVGNSGDGTLRAVNLGDKTATLLARFKPGPIDGICRDSGGNLLVSLWEGRLYRVPASGDPVKLLDTGARRTQLADFAYIPEKRLIVFPTFFTNTLTAFSLGEAQ